MGNAAEFLIRLNQQVQGPAAIATSAMQQVGQSATVASGAVRDASGRFVKAGTDAAQAAAKLTQAGQAAQQAGQAAGQGAQNVGNAAARSSLNVNKLGSTINGMASSATSAGGPVGKLQQLVGALGPQGQAAAMAIGLATIAITAFVGAAVGGMAIAIEVTEKLSKMRAQFAALAGSAAGGAKISEMVSRMGQQLPFATAQVADWTKQLLSAGLAGQRLENAVKAVAAAEALGLGGAAQAEKLFKTMAEGGKGADQIIKKLQQGSKATNAELAAMGVHTSDIAKALGLTEKQFKTAKITASQMQDAIAKAVSAKNAGVLASMMNTFPNILQKAREGAMSLFAGMQPQVERFMASVGKLFSAFNKGGFVIQMLKPIVTGVFGTLFTWASKALDLVYAGLVRMAIWAVKAYILGHPLIVAFKELGAAVGKLMTQIGALFGSAPKLGLMAIIANTIKSTFMALIIVLKGIVGAITFVVSVATRLVAAIRGALSSVGAAGKGAGGNLVTGLVQGIMGGIGAVVGAVKGLASSALSSFHAVFGMHSPSTVLRYDGRENMAGAVATGVNEGRPKVDRALSGLKKSVGGKAGADGSASSGGGDYFDFRGAHFGGDLTEEKLEGWLVRILQKARMSASEMEPSTS